MREDMKRLARFFGLFRKHWLGYGVSTAMVSLRNLGITWLTAYISSRVVAVVSEGGSVHLLRELILFLLMLLAFVLFDSAGLYAQAVSMQKISDTLRARLYRAILRSSIPDAERFGQRSELISRVNRDVDTACRLLSGGLLTLLMYTVSGAGATVAIARESWPICLGLYALGLIGLFAHNAVSKRTRACFSSMQKDSADALAIYMQALSQSADIRMAGLSGFVSFLFSGKMQAFRRHNRTYSRLSGASGALMEIVQFLGFFGVIAACLAQYAKGNMPLSSVVMLSQMASLILNMILSAMSSVASVHTSLAGVDRIFEVVELPEEDTDGEPLRIREDDEILVSAEHAACRFRNGASAFTDLNLALPANRVIALHGDSGRGKTTLARLLLKLYPYTGGSIRLFGQEVRACSAASIRKATGFVPQENVVFSGSVRDNLLIGNERQNVDDLQIREVLEGVGANWVFALEKGLDTPLTEGGQNLSGGQRQMLALARAILYRRPILILDEAFAGVDAAHIERIMAYLHALPHTRSVLIITHDEQVRSLCDGQLALSAD